MKKTLEDELMSLAHRVLQLRGRGDIDALKDAAGKIYEKLAVLSFTESYFEGPQPTIGKSDLLTALENASKTEDSQVDEVVTTPEIPQQTNTPSNSDQAISDSTVADDISSAQAAPETEENTAESAITSSATDSDSLGYADKSTDRQEEESNGVTAEENSAVDFRDFAVNYDDLPQFEPSSAATPNSEKNAPEPNHSFTPQVEESSAADANVFESVSEPDLFTASSSNRQLTHNSSTPQKRSLNETLNHGLKFGLNDRIAFINHLFEGNQVDFDRVVSQLNTLNNYTEAKSFIETQIKPDYNWTEKEAIEERFYVILEKRLG